MQLEVLTTSEAFDRVGDAWNTLLKRTATNTLFLTLEWQRMWWSTLGDGELRVLLMRTDAGELAGIAPLYFEKTDLGGTQVQFVGCKEVSDYLDFIFARDHEEECLNAVLDYLHGPDTPAWDAMSLCNIPGPSPTLEKLPALAAARGLKCDSVFEDVCPIIALPGTFEAYLEMLDSKERRELTRKLRKAEDTTLIFSKDAAKLDADVSDFLGLMRASMVSKNDFMTPRMESFFRAAARTMFDAGYLQLAFLENDGERMAAYMNFVWDNQVLIYNSGLDPMKYSYLSPGQVLIARLIETAIAEKRDKFDFLQGNEEYKYKLGAKDISLYTLSVRR